MTGPRDRSPEKTSSTIQPLAQILSQHQPFFLLLFCGSPLYRKMLWKQNGQSFNLTKFQSSLSKPLAPPMGQICIEIYVNIFCTISPKNKSLFHLLKELMLSWIHIMFFTPKNISAILNCNKTFKFFHFLSYTFSISTQFSHVTHFGSRPKNDFGQRMRYFMNALVHPYKTSQVSPPKHPEEAWEIWSWCLLVAKKLK